MQGGTVDDGSILLQRGYQTSRWWGKQLSLAKTLSIITPKDLSRAFWILKKISLFGAVFWAFASLFIANPTSNSCHIQHMQCLQLVLPEELPPLRRLPSAYQAYVRNFILVGHWGQFRHHNLSGQRGLQMISCSKFQFLDKKNHFKSSNLHSIVTILIIILKIRFLL